MKQSSVVTLVRLYIRGRRIEGNVSQKEMAESLGFKSVSAWTKIENGQSPLRVSIFFEVCNLLGLVPSEVMRDIEFIADVLRRSGKWKITYSADTATDDLDKIHSSKLVPYRCSGMIRWVMVPLGLISILNENG